ncbi:hypothetical protein NDU88_003650 [Pleurodeles waltl]|uniref:Uncharacterized protein n=1 Tax=Pleurodeles waltl TaxID=8319 RepID=A0AAV7UEV2_PLEWA|nr:hypothetical protein NDU88_003650 [Pleurodeles waltl]
MPDSAVPWDLGEPGQPVPMEWGRRCPRGGCPLWQMPPGSRPAQGAAMEEWTGTGTVGRGCLVGCQPATDRQLGWRHLWRLLSVAALGTGRAAAGDWSVPKAHSALGTPGLSGCERDSVEPPCLLPPGGALNQEDHHPLGPRDSLFRCATSEATFGPAEEGPC